MRQHSYWSCSGLFCILSHFTAQLSEPSGSGSLGSEQECVTFSLSSNFALDKSIRVRSDRNAQGTKSSAMYTFGSSRAFLQNLASVSNGWHDTWAMTVAR